MVQDQSGGDSDTARTGSASIGNSGVRSLGRILVVFAAGVLLQPLMAHAVDPKCAVPREIYALAQPLPVSSARVIEGKPLKIVAIGSSTTQGASGDDPAGSYPARLEMELLRRLPGVTVEVVNQGVSGQLARQMVERFELDVIEEDPSLVIWQTGLNDVVAGIDVADFRDTLRDGIQQLKAAKADVILMDLQYYRNSAQFADYDKYLATMGAVAAEMGVPIFRRHASMKHLLKDLKRQSGGIMASNLFTIMELNYRCVPLLLADAIFEKLHDALFVSANAPTAGGAKR